MEDPDWLEYLRTQEVQEENVPEQFSLELDGHTIVIPGNVAVVKVQQNSLTLVTRQQIGMTIHLQSLQIKSQG